MLPLGGCVADPVSGPDARRPWATVVDRPSTDGRHVATSFSFDQEFAADPATVLAMLRDPAYVQHKAERTGGTGVSVAVAPGDDGGFTLTCTRSLPAEVPSYAKSFVGDTITVSEVQVWSAAGVDGSASATATVDFHAPVAYTGSVELAASGTGTVARNRGEFKANVPFVGGKVERLVAEQTQRYLAKETEIAADWLARG